MLKIFIYWPTNFNPINCLLYTRMTGMVAFSNSDRIIKVALTNRRLRPKEEGGCIKPYRGPWASENSGPQNLIERTLFKNFMLVWVRNEEQKKVLKNFRGPLWGRVPWAIVHCARWVMRPWEEALKIYVFLILKLVQCESRKLLHSVGHRDSQLYNAILVVKPFDLF